MIPADFIQALLQRVDIVEVIDQRVTLRKAGSNYVACCPFHNEKTPSFTVSPSKQFYYCFGCGAKGSAIGFLMEHGGLPFVEAVEELAEQVGMSVPDQVRAARAPEAEDREDLSALLAQAMGYYRDALKRAPAAIEYLKGRGLSGQIAARFGVGYAPDGWQNLASVFSDYQARSLVDAGLVIEGEGKRYDRFRDRIMFPIVSQRGEVIGFGGRVLGQGEPKYLNSPETPVFEKGRELYGLPQAAKAIREAKRALVVEGYMDVVALAQHGVEYAVATLGTATSAHHVQRLLRMTDQVIFSFDGDAAGRRAAWRALEVSLPLVADGKQLSFLFLPQGEDPDSFIRSQGKAAFEALLGAALPLSGYLLSELTQQFDLKTEEGKAAFLQRVKPLLKMISAPVLSLMLRKRLADTAGLTREELDRLLELRPTRLTPPAPPAAKRPPRVSAAMQLAAQVITAPKLALQADLDWSPGEDDDARFFADLVEICRAAPHLANLAQLVERMRGSEHETRLTAAADRAWQFEGLSEAERETEFREGLARLKAEAERQTMSVLIQRAKVEGLTEDLKQRLRATRA